MNRTQKAQVKASLQELLEQWLNDIQDSGESFDCYVGDETESLMADAAFSVIEAIEDAHAYMKREGLLKDHQ